MFYSEHKHHLKETNSRKAKDEKWIQDMHNRRFISWFHDRVAGQLCMNMNAVTDIVKWLAQGPRKGLMKYSGYAVDGYRYHTKARDNKCAVQSSGVCLVASTMQVSCAKDKNTIVSNMKFYGFIEEIWELNSHKFQVPLFKCAWVENEKGIKYDDDTGLTMVNLNRRGYRKDEFVMATHVSQVFYIDDPENDGWSIVLPMPNRVYVHGDELDDAVLEHQSFTNGLPPVEEFKYELGEGDAKYIRTDCEGIWVTNRKKGAYMLVYVCGIPKVLLNFLK
ncbi:hypothetical protein L3X38_036888 [Prunus dulcis]|uniref:DUF4216 domain-containing protein n=1 Tax=Prunus dulcis TaxID=3755 RepID=A0AAD4YPV7_PRUDU|nr:hypothetical protein L3X38_036888 [Prunus dulcis]